MSLSPVRRKSAAIIWWMLPVIAIGGWFYPYLGYLVLGCMLAPVILGAFRGRYWCGWACPRGSFFDYIMRRFSRGRVAPAWLRSTGFRLAAMAFLMGMMGVQLTLAWPNPAAMGRVFVLLLGVTSIAGIALAIAYHPRTWCTFCPMGTMARWVSHGKRSLQVTDSCRSCRACEKVCPMGLVPQQVDRSHADCIKCGQCVGRCPVSALSFSPTPRDSSRQ